MNRNKLELAGNLTRDPELKYTPKGTAIVQFGIAVNRKFKAGDEMREETDFFDVQAWGRTAEVIGECFKKGHPIFIDGRLKQESWDDKDTGKKRYATRIIAESFEFMGGGKKSDTEQPGAGDNPPPRASSPSRDDIDLSPTRIPF